MPSDEQRLRESRLTLCSRLGVQVGFMSFYALPMFAAMADMFPEMVPMSEAVKINFQAWMELKQSR